MPLFSGRELLKQDVKVEYLVEPFLTDGGTVLLSAPLKSMKTFLGINLASAISSGGVFVDMQAKQRRVLYVDFEIGIAEAKKRYYPMSQHYGGEDEFFIRTADEQPLSLDPNTVGRENLHNIIKDIQPGVLFIDTLRMATRGEENSSTDMVKVFSSLRELKLKFGFTAVIIHHMGKAKSDLDTTPVTSRGSSVIEDSPDTIGYITKHATGDNEPAKLSVRWKLRNHAPIPDSRFTFDARSGLFIRTPAATKKVKNEPETRTEVESINVTDGLLPTVFH